MFSAFTVGFVGIIFSFFQLAAWPSVGFLLPVIGVVLISIRLQLSWLTHLGAGIIIGWISLIVFVFFNPHISEHYTEQTLWVEGQVVSLVEQRQEGQVQMNRMVFRISSLQSHPDKSQAQYHQAWWWYQPKIRLSCYRCDWQPQVDEVWRLPVRVKLIRGSMNPGGFDYEAWAYQQGLVATGYVRINEGHPDLIQRKWSYQRLRQAFAVALKPMMEQAQFAGIYQALLYADRQEISVEEWDVMRATGTIHLMAISGLHMALVGLMGFGLGALIWRLPIRQFEHYPVQWFGAAFAVVLVTLYGFLAGFSIPTQRAWIMVIVGVLFILIRRKLQPWAVLSLAAFLVVLWHPPSVLAQGFWLSFLAVALIFTWLKQPWAQALPTWQKVIVLQLVLSIGLMPALWWFHQEVPLYGALANLVAVPFVSFVGLPLLFISALVTLIVPSAGETLAWVNDQVWQALWQFLRWIAHLPASEWGLAPISLWQVVVLYFGLFIAALVKGRWQLILGVGLILIIIFWPKQPEGIQSGTFRLTLLDVGQGQALVVETANHRLVYDTGPRFGDRLDGSLLGITPYLKSRGAAEIDVLIVSHADNDHAGGTVRLLTDWPIDQMLTGEVERLAQIYQVNGFEACGHNQAWSWDGVDFKILSPGLFDVTESNDFSCVLQVKTAQQSLLITGDLHGRFEQRLVEHYGAAALASQLLVAGHHGSRHSSDEAFIVAIQPEIVLFSAGYRNRFDFPHHQVLDRVEKQGASWLNTACEGAIQIQVSPLNWKIVKRQRRDHSRWFHARCP